MGGFYPSQETYDERKKDIEDYKKELKTNRHAKRKLTEEPEDLVGHFIQYTGQPLLQLRTSKPLRPLDPQKNISTDSDMEPDLKQVPVVRTDPGFYGLEKIKRHGTNIPGRRKTLKPQTLFKLNAIVCDYFVLLTRLSSQIFLKSKYSSDHRYDV